MAKIQKSDRLYKTPFSAAYWRDAAMELKDLKMLVVAALMIAIRVAMKLLAIPLAPGLNINTAFIANALGAMIFGPVMASICAVVTDVLGYLIKPDGVYFVPFVLTEVAGSLIFALFLYRAKVTPVRVMLSRFCICFFVNVVLQTPIYMLYYQMYMGGKVYALTIPGIVKNLFMFPIESVVLTLFLSVMVPITTRLGLTYGNKDVRESLKFGKKQIALLFVLFFVGTASVFAYLNYYYDTTSLSASYSAEERVAANQEMQRYVLDGTDDWDDQNTLTVVESAYRPFLGSATTYTVAVYTLEGEPTEAQWGYSKSKAAADETLTRAATVTIVADDKNGQVLEISVTPEAAQ